MEKMPTYIVAEGQTELAESLRHQLRLMDKEVVLVNSVQDILSQNTLLNEALEREAEEKGYVFMEPQRIDPPPVFGGAKPKPTCERHHEYVERQTKDGNIIHSHWECRFCGKKL